MAYGQKTKDRVRKLYIEGMPLKGAATVCNVGYDTARDWKAKAKTSGDDWATARAAYQISDQGADALMRTLIEQMMRQAVTTMRELEVSTMPAVTKVQLQSQLSDAVSKFSKAMGKIDPKLSAISVALDVLKVIAEYLSKHDKKALAAFQEHLEAIGAIVQERHGG